MSYSQRSKSWLAALSVVLPGLFGIAAAKADPETKPEAASGSVAADAVAAAPAAKPEVAVPAAASAPATPAPAPVATPAEIALARDLSQLLAQSGFVDAGPGGFAVRSADKSAQLRFHLQIQGDGRFWRGTTPNKVAETFFLRRAIPWIDGSLPGGISFLLAPDFAQIPSTNSVAQGNAAIALPDAYLQLKLIDEIQLRIGKFRAPIGLERLQPTGQLFFNEFALATQLTPLREVGAQLQGDIAGGYVGYAAGVFNGAVDSAYTDIDSSWYKDVEGLIYVKPFGPAKPDSLQYLVLGAAGTAGRRRGGPQPAGQSTNLPSFKSPGGASIFSYKTGATPDATNTVIATGQQRRFNVHGYYSIGPVGVLAEYLYSQQRVGLNGNNLVVANKGFTAEASLFLFGGKASYSAAVIKSPFDLKAGTYGALELVGRVSQLRFDESAFGAKADDTKPVDEAASVRKATELAGGFAYYWNRNVRFLFSYNHTAYKGGAAGADRPAENLLTGRAQLSY